MIEEGKVFEADDYANELYLKKTPVNVETYSMLVRGNNRFQGDSTHIQKSVV